MNERDLEYLLWHVKNKLSKFVGRPEVAFQMKIHGKGGAMQIEVTEVCNLQKAQTLDERQR